jgi:acyl carrier protein
MQPLLIEVVQILRGAIPGAPELDSDTQLLASGLIDSLSLVAVVVEIEARFGFTFPPEVLMPETFETPAALHAVVHNGLRARRDDQTTEEASSARKGWFAQHPESEQGAAARIQGPAMRGSQS